MPEEPYGFSVHSLAVSGLESQGSEKSGCPAHHVDDATAGKVLVGDVSPPALAGQPAFLVPGPVHDDGVHEASDDEAVGEVRHELGAFSHRARDDGGGSGCEHEVEEVVRVQSRVQVDEEEVLVAQEGVRVLPEGPRVPTHPEDDGRYRRVQHVLHQDVGRVLGPHRPRLQKREAGLHEKHNH